MRLAVGDLQHAVLAARIDLDRDGRLGHHGDPPGLGGEIRGQIVARARSHHDRVAATCGQRDLDGDHVAVLVVRSGGIGRSVRRSGALGVDTIIAARRASAATRSTTTSTPTPSTSTTTSATDS